MQTVPKLDIIFIKFPAQQDLFPVPYVREINQAPIDILYFYAP